MLYVYNTLKIFRIYKSENKIKINDNSEYLFAINIDKKNFFSKLFLIDFNEIY